MRSATTRYLSICAILSLGVTAGAQSPYRVDSKTQWETWTFPIDAVELHEDGSVRPAKFEQPYNAALDAETYEHTLKQGVVRGGVRRSGSGASSARNVIDGDGQTYWRPDPADSLANWWLEIDLGRAVAVKSVRLHFPDEEGARPLRQFRVFGSGGKNQSPTEDVFAFSLIGGTTRWNTDTVATFRVSAGETTKSVLTIGQPPLDTDTTSAFAPLHYIRIVVDAKSEEAAMAEVEVFGFGKNIAPGTEERGGSIDDQGKGRTGGINDGDVNTFWEELNWDASVGGQAQWIWDLGAVYWLNRIVLVAFQETTTWGAPRILRHRLLSSDGRLKPSGGVDFDVLFDYPDDSAWPNPQPVTYLMYPYKPIRNLYMVFSGFSSGPISEAMIFPIGFVSQVGLQSGYVEISSRPKILKSLTWEADLPPGTEIQAQTRSGNTLVTGNRYYDRRGNEVTEKEYGNLKSFVKGDIVESVDTGDDWSSWSNVYQYSGQGVLSPSPRRYVQFKVFMKSASPDLAPTLRALSLEYTDALLTGTSGEVYPKEAIPGTLEKFTYTLLPTFRSGDRGIDRILLKTPMQVDPQSLAVRVDGSPVAPNAVHISPDSLVIQLGTIVHDEGVEIDMMAAVFKNPYLFDAFVGNSQVLDIWQAVDPTQLTSTTVYLPDIARAHVLLGHLDLSASVVTPNGDGVGDDVSIRFSVLKSDKSPEVEIYSLAAALVKKLDGRRAPDGLWEYRWAGTDGTGRTVAPGLYFCRIKVNAQTDAGSAVRTIGVAY